MLGHFAVFNQFTEIDSYFEGRFLERIAPGAFKDTFADRGDQIRVLYEHGADPMIGNKPLGVPDVLREDKTGAYYEVSLFDSSYVNDLKPAIRAGQLGASFRFQVTSEDWITPRKASDYNPEMLDERTVTGAKVYEFGPCPFGAYVDATAGLRSRTDEFIEHFLNDPTFIVRFKDRVGPLVAEKIEANIKAFADRNALPTAVADEEAPTAPVVWVDITDQCRSIEAAPTERSEAIPDETADGGEADTRERRLAMFQRTIAGFEAHLSRLERSP